MVHAIYTMEGVTEAGVNLIRASAKYARDHHPSFTFQWVTNISGALGAHAWIETFPSLAAYEELERKLSADPGWNQLSKAAGPGPFWTGMRLDLYRDQE